MGCVSTLELIPSFPGDGQLNLGGRKAEKRWLQDWLNVLCQ